jgi:hypothetical protein
MPIREGKESDSTQFVSARFHTPSPPARANSQSPCHLVSGANEQVRGANDTTIESHRVLLSTRRPIFDPIGEYDNLSLGILGRYSAIAEVAGLDRGRRGIED